MSQKSVYDCANCKKEFLSKKNKKFCCKECYFLFKKIIVEKLCSICETTFSVAYRFRNKKTCSTDCAKKSITNSLTTRSIKQCLSCNKEFEVIKSCEGTAKYCSLDCFYKHRYERESTVVLKSCEACGKNFEKKFIKRLVRFCSKKCATSGERNPMFGKTGTMTGKTAWNKGLTAKIDDRLYKAGRKISEAQKKLFKEGILSNKGEKNPMFGRTKDLHTPEQREKYSKAAIERIIKGVSGYKTGHLNGQYTSDKCRDVVRFKSSWELAAMMWWDRCPDVISYEYESQVVSLPDGRRAIPDFKVAYADGTIRIIEIKPTLIQNIKSIKEKLNMIKEILHHSGVKYELLGDPEIKLMIKELGEVFQIEIERHKNRQ